jgi:hypothetical protein
MSPPASLTDIAFALLMVSDESVSQMPDPERILEELERVLKSSDFKDKDKQKQVLTYLVTQALAGIKTSQYLIAEEVYKERHNNFDPQQDTFVRQVVSEIRKNLAGYYDNEGRNNSLRIELPPRTYTPVFKEQLQPPPEPGPLPPTPPNPPPRPPSWMKLLVAAGVFVIGALLACFLWLGQDRYCGGSISIADPKTGSSVPHWPHRYVVVVQRTTEPKQWFCRSKDYVVVEAIDLGQWYVQGRLPDGSQPSLTAVFGDKDTAPGTRFSVFVLSTAEILPTGPLPQSSPLIESAKKSAPVEVTLNEP